MKKIFKGQGVKKAELNEYSVGLARLKDTHIHFEQFSAEDIWRIGFFSLQKREITLGKIRNSWCICTDRHSGNSKFHPYYIIRGKKIIDLHKKSGKTYWDLPDKKVLIQNLQPGQLFSCFQSSRPHRRGRGPHPRIMEKVAYERKFYNQ